MTPEAMRIAIAEACGWKLGTVTQEQSAFYGTPLSTPAWFPPDGREWNDIECPDYPADLNAMHEAETVLTAQQKSDILCWIWEHTTNNWDAFHATADQRAEALLRTIGRWVD